MRVLLISLDDRTLRDAGSGVAERLALYAARTRSLIQVAYSPARAGLRGRRLSSRFRVVPTRSLSRATFPFDALALAGAAVRGQPLDLIETQDPVVAGLVGLAAGRLLGAPVVVGLHTEFFGSAAWRGESLRNRVEALVARWVVRQADGVRVVSDAIGQRVVELGVPLERIGTAPVPVDAGLFRRGRAETPIRRGWSAVGSSPGRREDHLAEIAATGAVAPTRLLFVGRLVPSKDLGTLLEALAAVRARGLSVELDVVGGGPDLPRCRSTAVRLGLDGAARFHGARPAAELADWYLGCDVHVLPTLYEGFGRVLVEAGLFGAPSIATRVGGVPEIVREGETGLLVDAGDPAALERAIVELATFPDRRAAMGRAAWVDTVARFDPERQADAIVAFWHRVAARAAASR